MGYGVIRALVLPRPPTLERYRRRQFSHFLVSGFPCPCLDSASSEDALERYQRQEFPRFLVLRLSAPLSRLPAEPAHPQAPQPPGMLMSPDEQSNDCVTLGRFISGRWRPVA